MPSKKAFEKYHVENSHSMDLFQYASDLKVPIHVPTFACPFCDTKKEMVDFLLAHIEYAHQKEIAKLKVIYTRLKFLL